MPPEIVQPKELLPSLSMKGSIVPLITPLLANKRLDIPGLENLLRYQFSAGTHGFFVAGNTGEFYDMPQDLRWELFQETVRIVHGRVPVFAGVSDRLLDNTVTNAIKAQKAGVNYLVVIPGYCEGRDPKDVINAVDGATNLPIVLYNPPTTGRFADIQPLTPGIMDQLACSDRIAGIKDSTGDAGLFRDWLAYVQVHPGFVPATGSTKNLYQSRGCFVLSLGNTHPLPLVKFFNEPTNGRLWQIRELKTQGLDNPKAIKEWWADRNLISSTATF